MGERRNGRGRTGGVEEWETVVRMYGKSIIINMYKGEKSVIKDHILSYSHLCEVPGTDNSIETESRLVTA